MMHNSAICEPRVARACSTSARKALLLGAVALAALAVQPTRALAQSQLCAIPDLHDDVCANKGGTIDDYIDCYRDFYDQNAIPAFRAMATCTHVKARVGIQSVLEASSALVTGAIKSSLAGIDEAVNASTGLPQKCFDDAVDASASTTQRCIFDLNCTAQLLQPYIDRERGAQDLDAYRRANYMPAHLTFFENVLLTARQQRAACDAPLQLIRKQLVLLADLKAHHLDYCQIMRQSADYGKVSHIEALGVWAAPDPNVNIDQYLNLSLSLSSQCGYYDFS
jgi:hypothetical protein